MTGKTILLQILTDSRVSNTIIIVYAISKILTSTLVVMYFGTEMIWRLPVLWTSFFVILGAMGGVSFVRKQVLELIDFTDTDLNKHVLRNLFVHGNCIVWTTQLYRANISAHTYPVTRTK